MQPSERGEAWAIVRSCVHCGFCTAGCPTYQVTGDELDGPRGRIYLMKSLLEGAAPGALTVRHLERCLLCRGCESACPSGVRYGRLLELVRGELPRSRARQVLAGLLRRVVADERRFGGLLRLARAAAPFLPRHWRIARPAARPRPWSGVRQTRRMVLLESCAQQGGAPRTNVAARRLLGHFGIELVRVQAGCCGELGRHLGELDRARADARANVDAWWPLVEAGSEAVVMTASGCGSAVKGYGELLADDPGYRDRARRVAALARDLCEVVAAEWRDQPLPVVPRRVALHIPCSLQHAQRLGGVIGTLLERAGHQLLPVSEAHLCCGAAGPYALLQPRLAAALRDRKLGHLGAARPDLIATANVGCQMHLASGAGAPVVHWVELLQPEG